MIEPEQLAGALERLDPKEKELLALSLGRRVPDEALARVYDVAPQEVARRRAAAIERLADELGAQRGEDLGAVLQALLDQDTWHGNGHTEGQPTPAEALTPDPAAPEPPEPEPAEPEPAEPEPAEHEPASEDPEVPTTAHQAAGPAPVVLVETEPVLEMLAAREGVQPPPPPPDTTLAPPAGGSPRRRFSYVTAIAGTFVAAVIGGAAAFVGLSEWDGESGASGGGGAPSMDGGTRHFVPELGGPIEAPFPSEPQNISCYSTATVNGRTTLYREPGGEVRIRLSARTEWGSPRVFGVIRRRGDWVSVQAPELKNGEVAWIEANRARLDCVRWSLHADLSRRTLYVRRDGRTQRKFDITIGRRGNPTPEGRFSVTDKLLVTDPGSPYGCCVLALSGHQTRLPASWPGGDRLAVHATEELSSIGEPASLGCLRVTSDQARWLIRTMPLGAPLFVRT